MINGLRHQARVLVELPELDESRDPHDNPLLAMAVASQADYLVSGGKRDVLTLKKIGTTRIVTPPKVPACLGEKATMRAKSGHTVKILRGGADPPAQHGLRYNSVSNTTYDQFWNLSSLLSGTFKGPRITNSP